MRLALFLHCLTKGLFSALTVTRGSIRGSASNADGGDKKIAALRSGYQVERIR